MTKIFLKYANFPIFYFFIAFGVLFQTTLFKFEFLYFFQPDFVLLAVIWCAVKRSFTQGGVLTLLFAQLMEIHSASPSGIYLTAYMGVYLMLRASSKYLLLSSRYNLSLAAIGCTILLKLNLLGLAAYLDYFPNQWRSGVTQMFPTAVVQGVWGYWVFRLLDRFDWITYKDPKAMQLLADELRLNEEGL